MDDDAFDDELWDRLGGSDPDTTSEGADASADVDGMDPGPPVRVTLVVRAGTIPVAPWAQGWRIGAIGPVEGYVTLVCEHDVDLSPVAQLSAVTGLLGTVKQAKLDLVWWAIQSRGPIDARAEDDLDRELAELLEAEAPPE